MKFNPMRFDSRMARQNRMPEDSSRMTQMEPPKIQDQTQRNLTWSRRSHSLTLQTRYLRIQNPELRSKNTREREAFENSDHGSIRLGRDRDGKRFALRRPQSRAIRSSRWECGARRRA